MFQFPTYALATLFIHVAMTKCLVWPGSPIRISTGRWLFAPLRSFSQLVTSFIAFWCLGIHPMLLVAWPLKLIFACISTRFYLFYNRVPHFIEKLVWYQFSKVIVLTYQWVSIPKSHVYLFFAKIVHVTLITYYF